MDLYKITKRNGLLADFEADKIKMVIAKAVAAVNQTERWSLDELYSQVINRIQIDYIDQEKTLSVENVQNVIEEVLMAAGAYDVARKFIIYRSEHAKLREAEKKQVQDSIAHHAFKIVNNDGLAEVFSEAKIVAKLTTMAKGLDFIDQALVLAEIKKNLYEGIKVSELKKTIINAATSLVEKHYNYSFLAARLLWDQLYEEVLGLDYDKVLLGEDLSIKKYQQGFIDYIANGIGYELLNPELANFDLLKLAKALDKTRDDNFQYLGAQTVHDRYLLKTPTKPRQIFELPQWLWMRVAMGLALREDNREERAIEFYNVMSQFLLLPSTPTLFNSGTTHSQLSSCYLNTIEDSIAGIFKSFSDVASMSKWSGGVGTDWTPVRAMGSKIKGTNGDSQGIIPFIKIFNDIAVAVNQGGKRRGALAAYLEVWHGDIEEFLELKKNTGDERRRAHDIHPACWIPDLFMKRVLNDESWTLFSPNDVPGLHDLYGQKFEEKYQEYERANIQGARQISAKDLWKKILTMLYETGHPWITFKDPCNLRSPQDHVGVVHNSNLCTEITLNNSADEVAVCNLASLNLARMICDGELDKDLIRQTVTSGMRMLDNVIDINFYTIKETETANSRHRAVGLGLMGYQDALYQVDIDFASEANWKFADRSMEYISFCALEASSDLAKERGVYQSYPGSKWSRGLLPIDTLGLLEAERNVPLAIDKNYTLDWAGLRDKISRQGMRNSNCLAIAPTATISNIAGAIPCVEPIFKNIYSKENMSGSFLVLNKYLVDDLMAENLWNKQILEAIKYDNGSIANIPVIPERLKNKYRETFEIEPHWVVRAAAYRGKWIDQSASTNIFVTTSSGKILSDIYIDAWKTGLKTTYYLRTLAASQITKTIEMPATEAGAPEASGGDNLVAAPKACLIDNPDCEACQ
ncbi:ribonucleoside-diphosphate reductase subunit alpha [Candidatus Parcubacteria bacterium]|nr:ribonucleoside-diphosphate reductase subunit alpha [Patescibacteria group bacterium]MBU4309323.1 ribonucleoside-diphosphate reductase subunit alpha [Patescibacteria group bacterium]MBU4432300.1 ribonucleoside-diphosphate reductase subunit alpha [Patescibacteria group bacterium]MBU4577684.1 ribonucleoside-diphosphate reductase subunit alpha [Patescibacteria group bacterium]MCG2697370.1 ribonucleoside-diphosphate reductase subunit alpha [Candidatus Parcubacteria bacterium]